MYFLNYIILNLSFNLDFVQQSLDNIEKFIKIFIDLYFNCRFKESFFIASYIIENRLNCYRNLYTRLIEFLQILRKSTKNLQFISKNQLNLTS